MKSLHLKISDEAHEKFREVAGDRKLGAVQTEIFENAVNQLHKKMYKSSEIMKRLKSEVNE